MEIKDTKGSENVVADHLSRVESAIVEDNAKEIIKTFPDEKLMTMDNSIPWYADFVNYLACNVLHPELKSQQRKKIFFVMLRGVQIKWCVP